MQFCCIFYIKNHVKTDKIFDDFSVQKLTGKYRNQDDDILDLSQIEPPLTQKLPENKSFRPFEQQNKYEKILKQEFDKRQSDLYYGPYKYKKPMEHIFAIKKPLEKPFESAESVSQIIHKKENEEFSDQEEKPQKENKHKTRTLAPVKKVSEPKPPQIPKSDSGSSSEPEDNNMDFCGMCGNPGTLFCCESCPAAYHCQCLGFDRVFLLQA